MSRIAIDLGFIQIYWYSIMIALGILVGSFIILFECKKQKIDEDFIVNLLFYGIIFGVIGARLYYILFNISYYSLHALEIFEIWNGGLAIHGGIIFATIFIYLYCKKNKQDFLKILDIIVVGLIAGQVIGRWGNFFNQEAFGTVVSLEFLKGLHLPQFVINGMLIGGEYHHPTFLYESIWNLLGLLMLVIARRFRYVKIGQPTALYMIWYGLGRLIIEAFRTDSLMLGPFRIAQIVSIFMIIIGVALFIYRYRQSRFESRYNERKFKNSISLNSN